MDGTRFDTLIKRLASTHVTRWQALRGLVAGATALTGLRLTTDVVGADKKGETKRKWCHRGDNFTILGKTKKLTKDKIKQHKKKHAADYKGKCTAARIVSRCESANCPKFETCVNNQCGPCTLASQCSAGEACLNGRCIGGSGRNAIPCDAPPECQAFSGHLSCEEVVGTSQFFCLAGTECAPAIQRPVVCPTAGETCVLGDCVVPCGAGDTCGTGFECRGGFCFD